MFFPKSYLLLVVFCVLSCLSSLSLAQTETITITTYYPAPFGVYNELATNKFAVDVTGVGVPAEFADMQDGDVHIGRSLIVGAGGTGFSYDELQAAGSLPNDGDVLIKGNVGIGALPNSTLSVYNGNESTVLADFTQSLSRSGLNIITDFTATAFTPGFFWSTQNDNPGKPKAGIWLYEDGPGAVMLFGTSNDFSVGITSPMLLSQDGKLNIGMLALPQRRLEVNGAIKIADEGVRPACNVTTRGTIWFDANAGFGADTVAICVQGPPPPAPNYVWRSMI